jgi:phospholipid/cholesterol/gamma-HCH transport system substrate-binding protein
MEREANYVAVGAFILLVAALAVGFVVWYSDASDGIEYKLYEIYFAGSVSGLERGGPVRYLGVDVGRVRRMIIDTKNPSRVMVVVEIDEGAPISSATRASLGLQGVTGLLYVNLKEAPEVARDQPLKHGEKYPIIESVASDFDAFLASVPELMSRTNSILERVGRVFSDENLEGLAETIRSVRQASNSLPQTTKNVADLVKEMRATVAEIHGAAESLHAMTDEARPEISTALGRMSNVADDLARAADRIDSFTLKSETQLGNFTEQGLFEIQRLVQESRSAATEFRDLSRSLKENPSQLIYEPQQSGVEIKP